MSSDKYLSIFAPIGGYCVDDSSNIYFFSTRAGLEIKEYHWDILEF